MICFNGFFKAFIMAAGYQETYQRSIQNAEDFWSEIANNIFWYKKPSEILLVADSLTGQVAASVAKEFNNTVNLTGIILTRSDGDGRGGAALSMKYVANVPIKFLGVGEKIENIEVFHPDRIANRILGMGDIVSLVEKASEDLDQEKLKKTIVYG